MIKKIAARYFPFIGPFKRFIVALLYTKILSKKSFSQHQEDLYILSFLNHKGIYQGNYLDIGANHPTDISNTYLLYKHGFSGLVVEPNNELVALHRKFRKRDIQLTVGCGEKNEILEFKKLSLPVLSSFKKVIDRFDQYDARVVKSEYLPIMKLDDVTRSFNYDFFVLLSIDTEGMDLEALKGGGDTLGRTLLVLIESNSEKELRLIENFLASVHFDFLKSFECNHLFVNRNFKV